MTEADWFTGTDFTAHVRYVIDLLSPRRQRLLAAGFCRTVSHLFKHPDFTRTLAVIESSADWPDSLQELEEVRQKCRFAALAAGSNYARRVDLGEVSGEFRIEQELAWALAFAATTPLPLEEVGSRAAAVAGYAQNWRQSQQTPALSVLTTVSVEQSLQMRSVVWEVVGNSFRRVELSPAWRTDTAISLAKHMYASRDFGAMPILADALQDAGCDNEDILNHCRDTSLTHIRGCWVIDLVLEKV